MKRIVVIPTYNEAENIGPLISAIKRSLPDLDVLVVDDGSPDGTARIASDTDGVHVIERPGKLGLGTAYICGFMYALDKGYDHIGGMDADFSHDPAVLPALFGLLDNHDLGIGARYIPGGGTKNWELRRRILSRTANLVAKLMLNLPVHDATSGYRSYRREVLEAIDLDDLKSEGYSFLVEILFRAHSKGYKIGETPIIFEERRKGESKLDQSEIWNGITNLFRLRFGNRAG